MSAPIYRTATLPDVTRMLDWAAKEGWNPGLADALAFHATDPDGLFVAEVEGEIVAAISVVNHSASFAFLGLYICRPAYRGRGIGYALWTHALAHAGGRTVGLDGVPAQQANYAASGFVLTGQTRRYCGELTAPAPTGRAATDQDATAIAQLDQEANGFERPSFLRAWVAQDSTRKTVVLAEAGKITGFATARLCREGCKIGPIVAPDADQALGLAHQAASHLGQTEVIIDVPDHARAFASRLSAHGFEVSFETARMYKGPAPTPGTNLQAIATMELG